jgi:hypothetical protein
MGQHWIEGRIESTSCGDASLFFNRPGWELCLTLQPWRGEDGAIQLTKLTAIAHDLDRESAQSLVRAYPSGGVVRLAPAALPAPDEASPDVAILKLEGLIDAPDLAGFIMPAPVFAPYNHPALGSFVKDNDYLPHIGKAVWNGAPIEIWLDGDEPDLDACAATAQAMLANAAVWQAEMTARAYAKMYANWNAVWREDEPALTEAEWRARLTIEALSVTASGRFTGTFADGDLYWGHTIEVSGSLAAGATDAAMCG